MADKKFFTSVNNTDIIQQSEDGGGIKLTTDGKFIFGAKHQNVIDQLSDENYNGTVDLNANNQSFIAVMNENSHAIEVEVPINHFSSLEIPTDNVVTTIQKNIDDCSKEFDEAAKIFLTHENDNTNLGWGPYGGAGPTLAAATTKYLKDYWNANNNNPPQPTEQTKLIKDLPPGLRSMAIQFSYNGGSWWTRIQVAANKLDTSLGITTIQSMNIDPVDPNLSNDINLIFANGSAYLRNESTGEKTSTIINRSETILPKDRAILFVNQYDSIIALYNTDKQNFLDTLEEEYRRYYKAYSQGKKDRNEYIKNNPTKVGIRRGEIGDDAFERWLPKSKGGKLEDLLTFYSTYVDLSKKQADKYVDCQYTPSQQPQAQQTSTTVPPPPSPSVSPTTSPTPTSTTVEEANEDIYEANFLPMNENDIGYINLGYSLDCSDAASELFNQIEQGLVTIEKYSGTTLSPITQVEKDEIETYVYFSPQAQKDYNEDIINPNTLIDIASICKSIGIEAYISTARRGHSCQTTSGNLSRHMIGAGLDILGFRKIGNKKFIFGGNARSISAVVKDFKILADQFVNQAVQNLGAARDAEGGNQRGVLWYFNQTSKGGNHFNHVHYSNKKFYSGWTPKCIPISDNPKAVDYQNIWDCRPTVECKSSVKAGVSCCKK